MTEVTMAKRPRSKRITDIGELQLEVLDVLCQLEEGTVYDVLDRFPKSRRPRYTTALSVLRALEKKAVVTHRTDGRAYVFRPVVQPAEVRKQALRDVIARVFRGSPRDLVATLLDDEAVTDEVLAELRKLTDESGEEKDEP
jgi:BlaI family penicillinase repressor